MLKPVTAKMVCGVKNNERVVEFNRIIEEFLKIKSDLKVKLKTQLSHIKDFDNKDKNVF